ncbi:hypothetical protein [Phaeovulum sp. NW3]|uniref:hypothetical protein n=1 Tax=Phaeovulum sp. NW3 TaxID=2934933 RepID=UPI00202128D6|nr:hypothetical protein [Phaeovulum sp. NW3]MCL7466836.1 hypothetical protein [Phaeovulum sp. NW3]
MILPGDLGAAFAQGQGQGQGQGGQGEHGGGQGGQGSQSGQGNQGQGAGQGGPDSSSDGKGPQAGGPADSSGGGKPIWAQEGIPEVELGRLSVARSPDQVLDRALNEALSTVNADIVAFYNLSLDDALTKLSTDWDNVTIYDSPLQSLALLKDVLADGATSLPGVTNDADTLAAMFLGIASDKNLPVSTETVIAITTILGYPVTGTDAEDLAADAEAIRSAVLEGHG